MRERGEIDKKLDAVLKSLSDPTRRKILERLRSAGELPVHALTSAGDVSQPAVSKHLARLKQAQLVAMRSHGRETFYRVDVSGLSVLHEWLRPKEIRAPPANEKVREGEDAPHHARKRRLGLDSHEDGGGSP